MQPFYFCLIDEVDSVLIDEARTPLVIGNPVPLNSKRFNKAKLVARSMVRNRHFEIDFKTSIAILFASVKDSMFLRCFAKAASLSKLKDLIIS